MIAAVAGVSGSGKTTLIRRLCTRYPFDYEYVKPFTTRELRQGEHDKIHISYDDFRRKADSGEIMLPSEIYGNHYGPSRLLFQDIISDGAVPIIDWPVQKLPELRGEFPDSMTLGIYVLPPDAKSLKQRLDDGRDTDCSRYLAGLDELKSFFKGEFTCIDLIIRNHGSIEDIAEKIHFQIRPYKIISEVSTCCR